jgi:adenylate kinase
MQRRTTEELLRDYQAKKQYHLEAAAKWDAKIEAVKNRNPKNEAKAKDKELLNLVKELNLTPELIKELAAKQTATDEK